MFDLYLGSGSTLIACEKTSRQCFGMELDPKYCDVIIKRFQDFTGTSATLEGTDKRFSTIAEERIG
jgi:DNA modification methylase